ncbi:MAG: hypothetical protein J6N76_01615, partial [Lachnospiraceae bacterium]|nr:hypothetical protein [Lachnospiraceae bacterium]
VKDNIELIVSGYKLKNEKNEPIADMNSLREMHSVMTYLDRKLTEEIKYMKPEILKEYQELRSRLGSLMADGMTAYYNATEPEALSLNNEVESLYKSLDESIGNDIDADIERLYKKVESLSFGEDAAFLDERLTDRMTELGLTRNKIDKIRAYVEEERENGRAELINDIKSLQDQLTVPPTPEELKLISSEDLLLRRVSSLTMLCHNYVETYKDKEVIFSRKRDYDYVLKTIKDLSKDYMLKLADRFQNKDYANSMQDMLFIGDEVRNYTNVAEFNTYNKEFNEKNKGRKNLESVPPQYRYYLKYAKAFTTLYAYKDSGMLQTLKEFVFDKDTKEKIEEGKTKARQVTNFLEKNVFQGLYTGLETEKEEYDSFFSAAYDHYKRNHKEDDADEERKYQKQLKDKKLKENDELIRDFYERYKKEGSSEENEDVFETMDNIAKSVEKKRDQKSNGTGAFTENIEEAESLRSEVEEVRAFLKESISIDVLSIETTDQRVLSFREAAKLIEEDYNKHLEAKNKAEAAALSKDMKQRGIDPEKIHKVFNKRVVGEKSDLKEINKTDSDITTVYLMVRALKYKYPGYTSDQKLKAKMDLTLISLQYNGAIIKSKKYTEQMKSVEGLASAYLKKIENANTLNEANPAEAERIIKAINKIKEMSKEWLVEIGKTQLITDDMEMVYETDDPQEYKDACKRLEELASSDNKGLIGKINSRLEGIVRSQVARDIRSLKAMTANYKTLTGKEERQTWLWKMVDLCKSDMEMLDGRLDTEEDTRELENIQQFISESMERMGMDDASFEEVSSLMLPIEIKLDEIRRSIEADKFDFTNAANINMLDELSEAYQRFMGEERVKSYLSDPESIESRKENIDKLGADIKRLLTEGRNRYQKRIADELRDSYVDITKNANAVLEKKERLNEADLEMIEYLKESIDKLLDSEEAKKLSEAGSKDMTDIRERAGRLKLSLDNRENAEKYMEKLLKQSNEWMDGTVKIMEKYSKLKSISDPGELKELDEHLQKCRDIKGSKEYFAVREAGMKMAAYLFGADEKALIILSSKLKSQYLNDQAKKIMDEFNSLNQEINDYSTGKKKSGFLFFSNKKSKIAEVKGQMANQLDAISALRAGEVYTSLFEDDNKVISDLEQNFLLPIEKGIRDTIAKSREANAA